MLKGLILLFAILLFACPTKVGAFARHISPYRRMAALNSAGDGGGVGLGDIGAAAAIAAESGGAGEAESAIPWKDRIQRSSAISRKVRGGNYVQIATVDTEGRPHCRTVVFRGFLEVAASGGGAAMRMITDARSEKVEQARARPACEMVWWFSKSSEQYRIAGELQFVGGEVAAEGENNHEFARELQIARKSQWGNLSDMAREQFYWEQPGVDHCPAVAAPPAGGRDADGKVLPPPENFLLMLLWPKKVKYLRLTDNFAQLDEVQGESWTAKRVNP